MGFFSTILDKLGLSTAKAATPPAAAPAPAPAAAPSAAPAAAAPAPAVVNPIAMVDVVAQLEKRAAANPQKLNWRTSIVDLLKLLDMDSSLQARKELAKELYCPDEFMNDSAQMNMWLHKNVLAHIAANGGNVPKELLN
jgi:pyruvate/2-oxoglutarate dehydrogenase complex dihydrolipoamide acyltransferase (E2) component